MTFRKTSSPRRSSSSSFSLFWTVGVSDATSSRSADISVSMSFITASTYLLK